MFDLVRGCVPCDRFEGRRRDGFSRVATEPDGYADLYPLECVASVRVRRPPSQFHAGRGGTLRHSDGDQPSDSLPRGIPRDQPLRAQGRQAGLDAGDVGRVAGTLRGFQQSGSGVPRSQPPRRTSEDHGGGVAILRGALVDAEAASVLRQGPRNRRQHLDRDRPGRLRRGPVRRFDLHFRRPSRPQGRISHGRADMSGRLARVDGGRGFERRGCLVRTSAHPRRQGERSVSDMAPFFRGDADIDARRERGTALQSVEPRDRRRDQGPRHIAGPQPADRFRARGAQIDPHLRPGLPQSLRLLHRSAARSGIARGPIVSGLARRRGSDRKRREYRPVGDAALSPSRREHPAPPTSA